MEQKYADQKKQMDDKIAALSEEQQEERERLLAQQAEEKKQFDQKVQQLETNMAEREEEHKQKLDEMLKIVEKKNYESHYPMPEVLRIHQEENPSSFNIQILGCRGAGKSTFINQFMKKLKFGRWRKLEQTKPLKRRHFLTSLKRFKINLNATGKFLFVINRESVVLK